MGETKKIFDSFTGKEYNVTVFYGSLPRITVAKKLASLYNLDKDIEEAEALKREDEVIGTRTDK